MLAVPVAYRAESLLHSFRGSRDDGEDLLETDGAVENTCGYKVSLEFAIPIDNYGNHKILVQNGWFGSDSDETFQ